MALFWTGLILGVIISVGGLAALGAITVSIRASTDKKPSIKVTRDGERWMG